MAESFDVFRYIGYLKLRWRWIVSACGIALAITLLVSLLMPREYTAAARIVIEPPARADLRAMAVSGIYLESLKTYESYASSDSLFSKALDQFGLRASFGRRPIESLKRRILKVAMLRSTRILEISVTLPDARKAQALALFLAEGTVSLARTTVEENDRELARGVEREAAELQKRLRETEDASTRLPSTQHRDQVEADRKAQIAELAALEARLREVHSDAGYRGERLQIIDPGIVPERPSSPNLTLNLGVALFMSLALSILYLTFEMIWRERRRDPLHEVFQLHHTRDE